MLAEESDADSDGVVESSLRYQWFTTDGTSINLIGTPATSATLDISSLTLPTGSVYGVTITYTDEAGNDESTTTIQGLIDGGVNAEGLDGTVDEDDYIFGRLGVDRIDGKGGGDHIYGGEGNDIITLDTDAGNVETIYYRFASADGGWVGVDGADTINNFRRGEDKLVFIDTDDSVITLTDFLSDANRMRDGVEVIPLFSNDGTTLEGVEIDLGNLTALIINYATTSQVVVRAAN